MVNSYFFIKNRYLLLISFILLQQLQTVAQSMPVCFTNNLLPKWEYEITQGVYNNDTCYTVEKKRWDPNSSRHEIFMKNYELRKEKQPVIFYRANCSIINNPTGTKAGFIPTGKKYEYIAGKPKLVMPVAPSLATLNVNLRFDTIFKLSKLEKYNWKTSDNDVLMQYKCNGNIAIAVFDVDQNANDEELNIKNVVPVQFETEEYPVGPSRFKLKLKQEIQNTLVVCVYYYPANFYKTIKDFASIKKQNNGTGMELEKPENAITQFIYSAYPSKYSGPAALKKYFFASEKDGSSLLGKGIQYETIYFKPKKPVGNVNIDLHFILHVGNAG